MTWNILPYCAGMSWLLHPYYTFLMLSFGNAHIVPALIIYMPQCQCEHLKGSAILIMCKKTSRKTCSYQIIPPQLHFIINLQCILSPSGQWWTPEPPVRVEYILCYLCLICYLLTSSLYILSISIYSIYPMINMITILYATLVSYFRVWIPYAISSVWR